MASDYTVNVKVSDEVTVSFEADTQVEMFQKMSSIYEILGVKECGLCKSKVQPRTRVVDDNLFPEILCTNPKCGAVLALGQNKKGGGLFPKRRDKDKNWLPNNGFVRWAGTPRNDAETEDEVVSAKSSRK